MVRLPDGEKILKICLFVSIESTNVTNTQTPNDGISRACIASRGKNLERVTIAYLKIYNNSTTLSLK